MKGWGCVRNETELVGTGLDLRLPVHTQSSLYSLEGGLAFCFPKKPRAALKHGCFCSPLTWPPGSNMNSHG